MLAVIFEFEPKQHRRQEYLDFAAELGAELGKIDGFISIERFESLTYDEVLDRRLKVMDATAIVLYRDNNMPLRVFNINKPGALMNVVMGQNEGTLVK